jgi:hypothetical protein
MARHRAKMYLNLVLKLRMWPLTYRKHGASPPRPHMSSLCGVLAQVHDSAFTTSIFWHKKRRGSFGSWLPEPSGSLVNSRESTRLRMDGTVSPFHSIPPTRFCAVVIGHTATPFTFITWIRQGPDRWRQWKCKESVQLQTYDLVPSLPWQLSR